MTLEELNGSIVQEYLYEYTGALIKLWADGSVLPTLTSIVSHLSKCRCMCTGDLSKCHFAQKLVCLGPIFPLIGHSPYCSHCVMPFDLSVSVICLIENSWVLCVGSVFPAWTHICYRWISWHSFIISVSLVIHVKSVLMRKMVFFQREKYISRIGDTSIKVDLMMTEALQILLTINLQQKFNGCNMEICIKISIIMYSEGQRPVVVLEKTHSQTY